MKRNGILSMTNSTRLRCGHFPWQVFQAMFFLALVCLAANRSAAQESRVPDDPFNGELTWKNGDKLPGHVVSGTRSRLKWQTSLFRDPLNLDLAYLDQIQFQSGTQWSKTSETYSIQTIDGFSLFGEITRLDDRVLSISSPRFGVIDVDRAQVASILNLKTSGSLINGEFDLDKWDANRSEKKYWKVNELGQLESLRSNVHLFLKTELPDSALIEVELEWEKKLDFTFGFGVPRNSRKIESLPRLESWDDSIVLSFNDDFEIVMESSNGDTKRMKFLIHWDRKLDTLVIHDEQGKRLAMADLGKPSSNIDPGIYIENKSGDLKMTSLMIRRSATGFNATEPSIQTLDEAAINGTVQSFDGTQWVISTPDQDGDRDGKPGLPTTVAVDRFCGAFLINRVKQRPAGRTRLKFHDGMYASGEFVSIEGDSITMKTELANEPITYKLTGATRLRFDTPASSAMGAESFTNRLFNNAGEIQGRLEKGTGGKDDILRWRVAGAESAVPLSRGDARIVLQKKQAIVAVADQWADTLYLTNRDTIPCHIVGMDERAVTIESFTEIKQIDQNRVKAIDFRNIALGEEVTVSDREWVILEASKAKVKVAGTKMEVSKNGEFGHPWLFSSGGFEFDLAWNSNSYGVLECRTLITDAESAEGGQKINIMLYGENLFVCNPGQANPANGMIPVRNNKAKFAFKFQEGNIFVTVNGKNAYSEKVPSNSNRGRGVQFKLTDMYQQNIKCTLSGFKLNFADSGNGILVDPQRKELLLTIPRLKKKTPPKQILCATNMDMLRGELVAMDDQYVMFRANHQVQRFPRDIVTSIVWLHAEGLADTEADAVSESGKPAVDSTPDEPGETTADSAQVVKIETLSDPSEETVGQTAQVLMQGGRRMTLALASWTDENLTGKSNALGTCQIPMDQIYELRFGRFASQATDVPYSDWVARLAPAPKMETGANGDRGSGFAFGSGSPLIGTTPKSFTAPLVGGQEFSLQSQLGKVVVLDFWATWCGPCVQALPKIEQTIAQYPSDQVAFLAVNQEEDADQISEFLETRNLKIPVALDSGAIGRQFDVHSLPQTVIIDQEGNVAFVKVGSSGDLEQKLKAAIDLLLSDDDEAKDKIF